MYIPFRRSEHFEALCEVFGMETAIALCRQLAPNGDRVRIPLEPTPTLIKSLGNYANHAPRLCFEYAGTFIYCPRLINNKLLEDARNGVEWNELCDRHNLTGMQLRILLTYHLGVQTRIQLFPRITEEMRRYIPHQKERNLA